MKQPIAWLSDDGHILKDYCREALPKFTPHYKEIQARYHTPLFKESPPDGRFEASVYVALGFIERILDESDLYNSVAPEVRAIAEQIKREIQP